MALKANERFENHMDVSSPETIGDAEKVSDFSEESHDPYDDKFDEILDKAEHSFEHDSANIIDDKKAADDTTYHINDGSEKSNSTRGPAHLGYCGLHISVGHLPGAGFHCGRYHAFPGSASLAGHIHRKAFRHSGKQRRQPQTAAGCAEQ